MEPTPIASGSMDPIVRRRSLRAVAPRRAGNPGFDDVAQVLRSTDLSEFERNQLAGAVIQTACETDSNVARRALIALYDLQTPGERAVGVSSHHNGIGFDREYGRSASELAERILGGSRLTGRELEKILTIIQRFRVQLIVHVSRESLRWVFEGDEGDDEEAYRLLADEVGPYEAFAAAEADDDDYDDDDVAGAEDDEDFIVSEGDADEVDDADGDADDDDELEERGVATLGVALRTKKRARRFIADSDDDDDDDAIPADAHADITVTAFGVRGALLFSEAAEALFQRALAPPIGAKTAEEVFDVMRGVAGLRVSDVHVRMWQLRMSAAAGPAVAAAVQSGTAVVVFLDGAFRRARVIDVTGGMLRLKMAVSGDLVWVVKNSGGILYMV
jgi:hypothetical protein